MSNLSDSDIEFLLDPDYWTWGPCFHIVFFFEQKCPLSVFEDKLLADSIVFKPSMLSTFSSDRRPRRCILKAEGWSHPLGFIYFQMDRGDHDDYFLSTYPRQIKRFCGQLHWRDLDNIQPVVNLHKELVAFVRRLHAGLGFHHVVIHHEDAPWFRRDHLQSPGILIYDWVAKYDDLENPQIIEPCYALLSFEKHVIAEAP